MSGLPPLGLPKASWSEVPQLLTTAASLFVVILAQSAATSRAYATRYQEHCSEDADLVGLGLACVGAGLSGTFVVNGSPSKTQMLDGAGGRSQIASLTACAVILVVLLFLTGPLSYLPEAVLAAVVFLVGVQMVDAKGMRTIFTQRLDEFVVALITAVVVVFVGVEQGILIAMAFSVITLVRHGYKPYNTLVVADDRHNLHTVPLTSATAFLLPGLIVYRFAANLIYANANRFSEEVLGLVKNATGRVSWLCIDAASINVVDFSGAATLRETHSALKEQGVRLVFAEMYPTVRADCDRSGLTEAVGKGAFFATVAEMEEAFQKSMAPLTHSAV
jgi:MFS superfamily sulfate permease-like transporter